MASLLLLEYKEKTGQFHHNMVNNPGPKFQPDTYGWESIAYTDEDKARLFCNIIDCKLDRRKALNQPPYAAEYIRKEWKHFSYIYNFIISKIEILPEQKEYIEKNFNDTEALARLGNGHFSDIKEDKMLPWAWEYNPRDFDDSNF